MPRLYLGTRMYQLPNYGCRAIKRPRDDFSTSKIFATRLIFVHGSAEQGRLRLLMSGQHRIIHLVCSAGMSGVKVFALNPSGDLKALENQRIPVRQWRELFSCGLAEREQQSSSSLSKL